MENKSKLTLFAIFVMMACACTNQNKYNVTGEISGMENDSIIIYTIEPVTNKSIKSDTVPVINNRFAINVPDTSLISIYLVEKPKGNGAIRMYENPLFLLLPGEKIKIHGNINSLSASGTEIYDKLNEATDINSKKAELSEQRKKFASAFQIQDKKVMDSLNVIIKDLSGQLSKLKLNYIKNNPNSLLSAYLFKGLKNDDGIEAEKLLGDDIKHSVLGEMISNTAKNYKKFEAMRKAAENIKPGNPAPDFRLKNLKGEEITLSSFKGKYALLDFWGTWCGWCIKGMPDMKKYYSKYKNKLEIVGICCRDTEEKWRKGVKDTELPWTNLYNGNSDKIVIDYAVSGYPTKILLDPQGRIVEIFVGESEDLYKKLDDLFK